MPSTRRLLHQRSLSFISVLHLSLALVSFSYLQTNTFSLAFVVSLATEAASNKFALRLIEKKLNR